MLKIGELFAGYGGLGMGVMELLDAEVAWVSEFDKHPSTILTHRFPDAPNLGDITKIDWATVEPVDIITGGSPCQDLSHAGQRLGMKTGTRSGLWANMLKAIKTIRPKLVVWENVGGAFSAEATSEMEPCPGCVGHGDGGPILRALGRVLGDLTEAGYDAEWHTLRAADIGAPHGRLRVFVTAWPRETGKPKLVGRTLISDTHDSRRSEQRGPIPSPPEHATLERNLSLLPTPAVNDMGAAYTPETWDQWTEKMKQAHGNGNGHGKSLNIEALRMLPTPSANIATNGGSQHPDKHRAGGHQPSIKDVVEHKLMPTPKATDGTKGGPNQRGSKGDLMLPSLAMSLLPTPNTANNENRQSEGYGPNLGTALRQMFSLTEAEEHNKNLEGNHESANQTGPCKAMPCVCDTNDKKAIQREARGLHEIHEQKDLFTGLREQQACRASRVSPLEGAEDSPPKEVRTVQCNSQIACAPQGPKRREQFPLEPASTMRQLPPETSLGPRQGREDGVYFGEYAPAIERWEQVLGRPAPAPTLPTGRGGKHQLSARFVEFLMGLPDGWVTDIPIARNAQLKALGNGVVPQQAAEALRRTLDPQRVFFNA